MNARHLAIPLLVLACASPSTAQDTDPTDWADAVRKAAEHSRFAVRRAAAGKIAQAGDAAVPAIVAFQNEAGPTKIPLLLVDAMAKSDVTGPMTEALLESWAKDVDFYWRSQALGGLARRAVEHALSLFRRAVDDASHLYRIEGARGLLAVGDGAADDLRVRALLADEDPRTRLRVGLMLLENGDTAGVGEIVAAVRGADRAFVDDPWGGRDALWALRELKRITGKDFTAALGGEGDERKAALEGLADWARETRPGWEPEPRRAQTVRAIGGVEIRSCRNGDMFVRWTDDGTVLVGLDPLRPVRADKEALARLLDGLPELAGVETHGTVICDYVRLVVPPPADGGMAEVHHKAAPSALPGPVHEWLKALADALDETGEGARLRERLGQFAATERKQ